jgi:phospholipase C
MTSRVILRRWKNLVSVGLAIPLFLSGQLVGFARAGEDERGRERSDHRDGSETRTPIKHVVVIIGENRSFDHIFATYVPTAGETVRNLLSEGIVKADGTPGPNYKKAVQHQASDLAPDAYENAPERAGAYSVLPPPLAGGPTVPFFSSVAEGMAVENGLAPEYYPFLTTGGTGQSAGVPDARISYDGKDVSNLPPGPFQLTPGVPYDAYAASPVHRFYQMRQQMDCDANRSTDRDPSGCSNRLFAWVEVTVGAGTNGLPQPVPFTDATTGEGSTAMGFYNVQQGDAPYLKQLADEYSMSDNYHQAVYGGTGANHVMMGTGDAIWFSDGAGNPAVPPHNVQVGTGSANQGIVDEIENPDPLPGTNNWYTEDGYGGGSFGSPSFGGGTYTDCSDQSQPGVKSVREYLRAIQVPANCEKDHYYLLNNYNPGYFGDGLNAFTDNHNANTVFTIPPSSLRTIGDELLEKNISWRYYGDQWNRYVSDPYYLSPINVYCNICNFEQYSTSIMTNATVRTEHLKDTSDLYADIANDFLPAVSFVKPSGIVDGHPASSKVNLFEGFVKKIVDLVKAHPSLWKDTAIFVTFDEGGGYYDSGFVQQLDYFGDGSRIPMIVVSPYSTGGHISHTYTDHVSPLKFIEHNWRLPPLTKRSRDNFPNPVASRRDPYVPVNGPAIGDLTDLFHFDRGDL